MAEAPLPFSLIHLLTKLLLGSLNLPMELKELIFLTAYSS